MRSIARLKYAGAGALRRPVKPQAAAGAKMGTAGSAAPLLVLDGWFWNCGLYATVVVGRTCATYESKQHDNENSSNDNNNNNDDNNK